jgi:hypothetical protein
MGAVAAITEPRTARFGAMVRIREQGQDQGAEGHAGLRLERKKNHLWAASALAVVKAVRCVSNRTRPVSWLGPATSGVHPHTKGARCFAGGHRHGLPSAQGASSRLAWRQAVGKPLMAEARHTDQGNGGGRDSGSSGLLAPLSDGGQTGRAHRCRRRRALGVPRNAGRLPHHRGRGWQGRGMRKRQVGLGTARRLRGASRLLAEDSSGSVPVQSG